MLFLIIILSNDCNKNVSDLNYYYQPVKSDSSRKDYVVKATYILGISNYVLEKKCFSYKSSRPFVELYTSLHQKWQSIVWPKKKLEILQTLIELTSVVWGG